MLRPTLRLLRAHAPAVTPELSVDHLVVGGGVIGLSVAAELSRTMPDKSTYLVERHAQIGQETSSRNSEVIHAGLYYPLNSLKSRYCITGREMMYERCQRLGIPHRKTQKLVVATTKSQIMYLDELHSYLQHPAVHPPGVPTYFLGGEEARELEPDLGSNVLAAMLSTESGIVDSHALMESLEQEVDQVVLGTRVTQIDRDPNNEGWVVQIQTEGSSQPDAILCKSLILSAGLSCVDLMNPLLPARERLTPYYVKGSYLSYKGPGVENVKRLLYPCPQEGLAGLGTHLTIDLAGNIKFGPDVQPLASSANWQDHLQPSVERLEEMAAAVQDYLPGIDPSRLTSDYAGIRPKLTRSGFADFHISYDRSSRPGLVALCGFESPGLTSSLAVGQDIGRLVRRDVWGQEVEDTICG